MLFTDRHYPRRITLRGLRRLFLTVGIPLCLIGAVLAGNLAFGLGLALSSGAVAALSSGSDVAPPTAGFSASLRMDRTAALVSAGCIAAVTEFLFSSGIGWTQPVTWLAGPATGLAAILLSAWGQLRLATLVLASVRRVPTGLINALHEARHRGVLRRAGGVYQFRHGLLRNRLSDADDPTTA
jgi:hypothetical protein